MNVSIQNYLLEITLDHGLYQMVNSPTHNNNILDLFFTNSSSTIEKYKILPRLSDHEAVLIQVKTIPTVQKQQQRKIYLYDKAQ